MAKSGSPILTSSWIAVPLSCYIVALVMVAAAADVVVVVAQTQNR
jgi:hypothetical protein